LDGKTTTEIGGDDKKDASNEIMQDGMSPPKRKTVVTHFNKQDESQKVGTTVFAGGQQVGTHASKQDDTPTVATVIATNNAGGEQGGSNGDDNENPEEGNSKDKDGSVNSHAIDEQKNDKAKLRKHCRHSEAEIVKPSDDVKDDHDDVKDDHDDVKTDLRTLRLPHHIKRIMFPKKEKKKKKTKTSDSNSLEVIVNDVIEFRKKQQQEIVSQKNYISHGNITAFSLINNEQNDNIFNECKIKTRDLVGENNSLFLLIPVHLLMCDDAMSKSFIYVSAFGQMYTYVLYCPNISKCPWVFEMLKKNRSNANFDSYTATDNVECLVLLHSPFIIDMDDIKEVINKPAEQNVKDETTTDFEDCNDAVNKYFSSFVFVTGCIYITNADNFIWLHSFAIDGLYTNFLELQIFLIYFVFNGVNATNCDIFVNNNSITTFRTVFSQQSDNQWVVLSTNPVHLSRLFPTTEGVGQKIFRTKLRPITLDQLQIQTIKSLLEKHYTPELKDGKKVLN